MRDTHGLTVNFTTPTNLSTAGFVTIYSNRLETLRYRAVELIKAEPLAPLENEVFLVQSNGIAQWLKMSLASVADGCGIAAAIEMVLPARFQWRAYRAVLGNLPEDSPFERSHLLWRLMRLLPDLAKQAVFASLHSYLANDHELRKRYQLALRLASLYDQYQVYRADWLRLWSEGKDLLTKADGSVTPVPPDNLWQPALWRSLLQDLPESQRESSRAHIHQRFMDAIPQVPAAHEVGLPSRVIVFGISALPQQTLEALRALSQRLPVYLFLHQPWSRAAERPAALPQTGNESPDVATDPPVVSHTSDGGNPLLSAWSRQGREYLQMVDRLGSAGPATEVGLGPATQEDWFSSNSDLDSQPTLLHQLQDDLLDQRSLPERRRWEQVVDPSDPSLVFHVAHSPQREVEILHDQLLAAFAADPDLHPRDVMVMVPDIRTYAPHIQAVFGQISRDDPRFIPFMVNDQHGSTQQTLMQAVESLLKLDQSRLPVSQMIDWLEVPSFRAAVGISPAEFSLVQRWIEESGIRWGFNADHRRAFGLPHVSQQNTWQFGLQRMLLGYMVGESSTWHGIEPYDRVHGLEAAVAGKLHALLGRLLDSWKQLRTPATPSEWGQRLTRLLGDFFLPQSPVEQSQFETLESALDGWLSHCADAGFTLPLPLSVVREHWLNGLDEPHLSQRFIGGAVNFATLMPMRAIPFRRICLLGMNDGDFPRQQPTNEFDLMLQRGQYRAGDRSRSDDDRYLFLEAILSARDSLYVSWVGRSIKDNSPRPPSVLVGQLRDHISAGWTVGESQVSGPGKPLATALTTYHPLQPFSREYFSGDSRLFTFANRWRDVHDSETTSALPATLPPWRAVEPLTLTELSEFLRRPVEQHFWKVMQVRVWDQEVMDLDREPFLLDNLQHWSVNQEILQPLVARLREDLNLRTQELVTRELQRLAATGRFPHPPFDEPLEQELFKSAQQQIALYRDQLIELTPVANPSIQISVTSRLHAGELVLEDSLSEVFCRNDQPGSRVRLLALASDLKQGKHLRFDHLVQLWPQHLALCLVAGNDAQTVVVHRGSAPFCFQGMDQAEARQHLEDLLQWYELGMQQPLPVACKTAFESLADKDADNFGRSAKARLYYDGSDDTDGEVARSALQAKCWPDFSTLSDKELDPNFSQCVSSMYQPVYQFVQNQDEADERTQDS